MVDNLKRDALRLALEELAQGWQPSINPTSEYCAFCTLNHGLQTINVDQARRRDIPLEVRTEAGRIIEDYRTTEVSIPLATSYDQYFGVTCGRNMCQLESGLIVPVSVAEEAELRYRRLPETRDLRFDEGDDLAREFYERE